MRQNSKTWPDPIHARYLKIRHKLIGAVGTYPGRRMTNTEARSVARKQIREEASNRR